MGDDIVKEGVKLAEEELKKEEKMRIKSIVKATLELLREKEGQRHKLDEEIKILKRDIDDLRDGRIDRIKERQDLDPKAKEISVIIIKEKIIEKIVPAPWYIPWIIEIKPQYIPVWPISTPIIWGSTSTANNVNHTLTTNATTTDNATSYSFTTNNSMTHMYAGGTYLLEDGTVKYL